MNNKTTFMIRPSQITTKPLR